MQRDSILPRPATPFGCPDCSGFPPAGRPPGHRPDTSLPGMPSFRPASNSIHSGNATLPDSNGERSASALFASAFTVQQTPLAVVRVSIAHTATRTRLHGTKAEFRPVRCSQMSPQFRAFRQLGLPEFGGGEFVRAGSLFLFSVRRAGRGASNPVHCCKRSQLMNR